MSEYVVESLEWTIRIASIGVVVTALELVSDRRSFDHGGPFSTMVFTSISGRLTTPWMAGSASVALVASVQVVVASVLVVIGPFPMVGRIALVVATATAMLLRWRRAIGGDGAEQLTIIVLVAALAALIPVAGGDRLASAVAFVAAQAALAYVTAGISKLVSPMWRSGTALAEILATTGHGNAWAARKLQDHPRIATQLTWGVMFFEILFPLLMLSPTPVAVLALAAGLTFHLGCAALMGLNSFVWAFPATYPCVLCVRASLLG